MKLSKEKSILVIVDIQERLFKVMDGHALLQENLQKIIQGVQTMDIPVIITEQYPQALGATLDVGRNLLKEYAPIEKLTFSCCGEGRFVQKLEEMNRDQILVCGIEAHICVYQTCMDLIDNGYEVHLLTDVIASRKMSNKELAIRRMEIEGIKLTSVEMVLFELLQIAKGYSFKKISKLIK